jgi:N-acetylglucosaminyl-diphospho-decaprenol L-rhamnosyltransferase
VKPDVSFSIVSHSQGSLIKNLLCDLEGLADVTFELIVTINLPENEDFLESYKKDNIRVIRNKMIKGFGANHNAAFDISTGRYFVIVNPDIRAVNLKMKPLIDAIRVFGASACVPVVYSPDGKVEDSVRKFPSLFGLIRRLLVRNPTLDYMPFSEITEIDWVAGMFVVFDRYVFDKLSGFDERYFMYMEDVDICMRMNKLGYKVIIHPDVNVVHNAQRASRRNIRHLAWHINSALRYFLYR